MDINVTQAFQQVVSTNQIYVLKSNPILKGGNIKYVGQGFLVQKKIVKIQPHWTGKKRVLLQNVKVKAPKVPKKIVVEAVIEEPMEQSEDKPKMKIKRGKKDETNFSNETSRGIR